MDLELLQLVGIVVGAVIGLVVGVLMVSAKWGGSYRHAGGGWFEVVKPGSHGCRGCLLEIVLTLVGAGVGFLVGSFLGGL